MVKMTDRVGITKDRNRPEHFTKFLKGTFNHSSSALPERPSFLLSLIARFVFGNAKIEESHRERLRAAAEEGTVLLAIKDRTRLEYLLLWFLLRKEGLPYPRFCHYISMYWWQTLIGTLRRIVSILVSIFEGKGYPNPYKNGMVAELTASRKTQLIFLKHFSGGPLRFGKNKIDPLSEIISIRQQLDRPVKLVPIHVIYTVKPDRETRSLMDLFWGTRVSPGKIRRFMLLLRYRKQLMVQIGEPMDLEDLVEKLSPKVPYIGDRLSELAYAIRQHGLRAIEKMRRSVLGPAMKSRSEIVEAVLHDQELTASIIEYCRKNEANFIDTRRRARRYAEEIASDFRPGVIVILYRILTYVFNRMLAGISVDKKGLEAIQNLAGEMPIIYVPCHKSHMDYLLVSYSLYSNYMNPPFILAGINLSFWPLGPIFRSAGAFFMRRAFKGKRIYTLVFSKYVEMMLREGLNLEFFLEGGRSRTGKIIQPRLGFISILLSGIRKSGVRDVAIAPVSINYERIFEENFYLDEASGKAPSGENIKTIIKNRAMIFRHLGKVEINFPKPFSLREFLWEQGITSIPSDRTETRKIAAKIAYRAAHVLNREALATPIAVVSAVLLSMPRKGMLLSTCERRCRILYEILKAAEARIADSMRPGTDWVHFTLDSLKKEKLVRIDEEPEEDEERLVYLDENSRLPLAIYSNSIIQHYQFSSLLSLVLLSLGGPSPRGQILSLFTFLHDVLAGEFVYGPSPEVTPEEMEVRFDEAMELFTGRGGVQQSNNQQFVMNEEGWSLAELVSSGVAALVETYLICGRTLKRYRDKNFTDREWIKKCLKAGERLYSLGNISRRESVHKVYIESALKNYARLGACSLVEEIGVKSKVTRTLSISDNERLEKIVSELERLVE